MSEVYFIHSKDSFWNGLLGSWAWCSVFCVCRLVKICQPSFWCHWRYHSDSCALFGETFLCILDSFNCHHCLESPRRYPLIVFIRSLMDMSVRDSLVSLQWCRRAQCTLGNAISWADDPGMNMNVSMSQWMPEGKPTGSILPWVLPPGSCLKYLLQSWTKTWKYKPHKPFLCQLLLFRTFPHSTDWNCNIVICDNLRDTSLGALRGVLFGGWPSLVSLSPTFSIFFFSPEFFLFF